MAQKREPVEVTEAEWGDHPVFAGDDFGHFDNGGWFSTISDLRDWCNSERQPVPATVRGSSPIHFRIHAESMVESQIEDGDHYEDAFADIDASEIDRLQTLLDDWCAAQNIVSYSEDRGTVVRLDGSPDA